jgi:hypothetical protein
MAEDMRGCSQTSGPLSEGICRLALAAPSINQGKGYCMRSRSGAQRSKVQDFPYRLVMQDRVSRISNAGYV